MSIKTIINEIVQERSRQDDKYGGTKHDDQHRPADWQEFIQNRTDRLTMTDAAEYRKYLVQIAALAVAAIQSADRKDSQRPTK